MDLNMDIFLIGLKTIFKGKENRSIYEGEDDKMMSSPLDIFNLMWLLDTLVEMASGLWSMEIKIWRSTCI